MSQDIYQQGIKELAVSEHGAGSLEDADVSVTVDNPLCGDRLTLGLKLHDGRITAIGHRVRGCLLCRASASAIGVAAMGCSEEDVELVYAQVSSMLSVGSLPDWSAQWQSLSLFQPVQAYKSRRSCVLLPFQALTSAFQKSLMLRPEIHNE